MSSHKGFTLIELLVVISIITILASLSIVGIMAALSTSDEKVTEMMIQDVASALEQYQLNEGLYPDVFIEAANPNTIQMDETGENLGIETCLLILRAKAGFPIESYQDKIGNTDEDQNQTAYEYYGLGNATPDMFELVDPWGNPLVYIPEARYGEEFIYVDASGERIYVHAEPLAKTGTFPQGYMIWSFGPDGENKNGKGDDITSWKKSEEDKKDPDEMYEDDFDDDDTGESYDDDDELGSE